MISFRRALPVILILASQTFISCAGFTPYKYWNVYRMVEPAQSSDKVYTDENIEIRFWIDEKKIHFKLKNLADQPISVNWESAAFINVDDIRYTIANIDSLFTDRRDMPSPTVIPPGESVVDFVAPVKNVEKLEEWTWYVYPLFNLSDESAYDNKGKVFGLDMPVQIGDKSRLYSFRFEVAHVIFAPRRLR